MDLVYGVRDGENEELRYSLRSVAANLPHDTVWIIGGGPAWLTNIRRIRVPQTGGKYANSLANLHAALSEPAISDPFILMCDDFYVLEPIDTLPVLHCGPLTERTGTGSFAGTIESTRRLLAEMGHADPLCYDLHVPMAIRKDQMRATLAACAGRKVLWQTVYGNTHHIGGQRHPNAKVRGRQTRPPGPFVSTNDLTFADAPVGQTIRLAFTCPSPHET